MGAPEKKLIEVRRLSMRTALRSGDAAAALVN